MIRVLEEKLANMIAAGEVITSPAAVVKELLENALDAGATAITCEIRKGGKEYIRVTDNGSGIPAEEVEIAFEKHATGKIAKEEDLDAIATLGFRGEALGSIATVSDLTMITKTAEETVGTRILMKGGKVEERKPVGCETGTSVTVMHLFYNTPARLKFMASDRAEGAKIHDLVSKLAIAYPEVRFKYIHNDNILFTTPGKGDGFSAVMTVYGGGLSRKLIPVEAETPDGTMSLRAYISDPMENRPSKRNQIFFVNGRLVSDKTLDRAVSDAYKRRMFAGRYPLVYLFLDIARDKLDVNIHPSKDEVRFYDPEAVLRFVEGALAEALATKEAVPKITAARPADPAVRLGEEDHTAKYEFQTKPDQPSYTLPVREEVDIKDILSTLRTKREEEKQEQLDLFEKGRTAGPGKETVDFTSLIPMGILFNTYILAKDEDFLYLFDQHAAHERILFEQVRKDFKDQKGKSQILLTPVSFETAVPKEEWEEALKGLGFVLEDFGPATYLVREIPLALTEVDISAFLADFADSRAGSWSGEELYDRMATMACKAAVKAHDVLSDEEVSRLLTDLSACENPFSCPHGRPTFLKMSQSDIERDFKRK